MRAGRAPGPVDVNAIGAAVRMARWCLRGTRQVYATLGLGAKPLDPPEQFLRGLPASFTTAEALEAATGAATGSGADRGFAGLPWCCSIAVSAQYIPFRLYILQ